MCASLIWVAISGFGVTGFSPVSQAQAQPQDIATQAMFLAVERNDLPGVRAAIDGGADIEARDYNGMQSVDFAIDRGYFDIAHYLISVRNLNRAGPDTPVQPTPSPKQLAETAKAAHPQPPPAELALPKDALDPFSTPRTGPGLPIVGAVQEPPARVAKILKKPSASKKFITTFLDFFKPPNTTGISRNTKRRPSKFEKVVTENELAKQLKVLEAAQGAITITPPAPTQTASRTGTQMPHVQGTPESIQKRIFAAKDPAPDKPPSSTDAPIKDAFTDMQFSDAAPADAQTSNTAPTQQAVLDPSLPFGGRVDPDILALFNPGSARDTGRAQSDPFAMEFGTGPDTAPDSGKESVAGLLEGLGSAQNIPVVGAKRPPPLEPSTAPAPDPFAAPAPDPFASPAPDPFAPPTKDTGVGALAGLLDTPSSSAAAKSGWDVKAVEGGTIPGEVFLLDTIEPTGKVLDNVQLTLGKDTAIGQEVGAERLKLLQQKTIHRPCLNKGNPDTLYCVDKVLWPPDLEKDFLVDTIMYQGTRAVARYDAGRATNFHALFNTLSFAKIINYFTKTYGQPTQVVQRAIAPLAQPRMDNPTYIWQSRETGTDTITTLEIRKFDDLRGSFPDTKRGAILLYRTHSGSIFPQLSQLELMVLKAKGEAANFATPTPASVW